FMRQLILVCARLALPVVPKEMSVGMKNAEMEVRVGGDFVEDFMAMVTTGEE
ncbi:hypothetical protein KI387_035884, partial [Taxus chinensis]